ncbi:MAG: phosphomannomutase/phosphoglucomutase [Halobacteriales archaeon]
MSKASTSFFHAYDLRGVHPDEIGVEEARRVGMAFGSYVGGSAVVGRDGRSHASEVTEAFVDGVTSTGCDVVDVGAVPTPVVYFVSHRDSVAAAVVTASHNPPEYTGFKFNRSDGVSMSREGGMSEIQRLYETGDFDEGDGDVVERDVTGDYVAFAADSVDVDGDLSVVANYGNGVAGDVGTRLLEAIGCNVHPVNDDVDGVFPVHPPNPMDVEARAATLDAVGRHDADLGLVFDGDGDRVGLVLPSGYVDEDTVLALLARRSLARRKGDVVYDLRASRAVPEVVREAGGNPVESRVGHTYISEAVHERDAVFAGEISGHYYLPAFGAPWDDGLLAGAVLCEIAGEGGLADEVASVPGYPVSPELRLDCSHEAKQAVVETVAEAYSEYDTTTLDGVKVEFPDGEALVRPSNTEEKISVRCEAESEQELERILGDVEATVREAIENAA